MKILLSPSKTQDFFTEAPMQDGTPLLFATETKSLASVLKKMSAEDFGMLMSVSPKLSALTYTRFQKWNTSFVKQKKDSSGELSFKQAIFAFKGDVYRPFDTSVLTTADLKYAEKSVRIISGFYGMLTPLTRIKPYRLEMGTRLSIQVGEREYKNLYEYWKEIVTQHLRTEMRNKEMIVNLASVEYSKAIDLESFGEKVMHVDFKVMKDGTPKTIGIFAKRQRGEMAHWMIKNQVEDVNDLKRYRKDGFRYSASLSKKQQLVFLKKT